MSKIFKISGNFTQNGEWTNPDPAFAGEIVVNETGKFYGWCDQYSTEGTNDLQAGGVYEIDETRYLIGALAKEGDGYSLLFFKLSNAPWQTPLLYEIHDVSATDCIWAAMDFDGDFAPKGNAMVSLEEIPYSKADAEQVRERFYDADISINENDALVQEVASWHKKSLVLWV